MYEPVARWGCKQEILMYVCIKLGDDLYVRVFHQFYEPVAAGDVS